MNLTRREKDRRSNRSQGDDALVAAESAVSTKTIKAAPAATLPFADLGFGACA